MYRSFEPIPEDLRVAVSQPPTQPERWPMSCIAMSALIAVCASAAIALLLQLQWRARADKMLDALRGVGRLWSERVWGRRERRHAIPHAGTLVCRSYAEFLPRSIDESARNLPSGTKPEGLRSARRMREDWFPNLNRDEPGFCHSSPTCSPARLRCGRVSPHDHRSRPRPH